jgi:hypothetical protein
MESTCQSAGLRDANDFFDHFSDLEVTCGSWSDEKESACAFDRIASQTGLFEIHREVCGVLIQPRLCQVERSMRIDRVLVPTPTLLNMGWTHGPIGVELKRSGEKLGRPLAQMDDYSRSIWTMSNGTNLWLTYIFLWPAPKLSGTVASSLAQRRLGTVYPNNNRWSDPALRFFSGEVHILNACVKLDGTYLGKSDSVGRKAGSRG